jgi:hypothetical protein
MPLGIMSILLIAIAGLFWYKSSRPQASNKNQLIAFIFAPLILTPITSAIYFFAVVMPIYGLV